MCESCACKEHGLTRRRVLTGAAAIAGSALWGGTARADDAPPNGIAPGEALGRLMEGNARYLADAPLNRDYSKGRAARAAAQYPIAAILSCSDSRVAPELVFDQAPGELFIVRVAGNFVNDDGLASLEYAVKYLGVPLVMVMGHSGCGAVDAAIKVVEENASLPGHLNEMIREIRPAVDSARGAAGDRLAATIDANVRRAVQRLETADPILSSLVGESRIAVSGSRYDIATGRVSLL